ncbi:MAG: phosphoribosylformylglycinamidine synthase I [Candidatus Omnitrophota bacterium]
MVKVLILRTAGTNCDLETEYGFRLAGTVPERVHINRLLEGSVSFVDYAMLVIPGGFSYGDDLSAGKVLANELRFKLREKVYAFAETGRPIIGICNGFQVLVKTGLLPFFQTPQKGSCTTLTFNDSGKFEDRWVSLRCAGNSPLLAGLSDKVISLPVAHGEGKFLVKGEEEFIWLKEKGQVAFQYADPDGTPAEKYPDNPNGSQGAIAGVTNEQGNVLGMMPHPERFLYSYLHPRWTRGEGGNADGLNLLKSFVHYVK